MTGACCFGLAALVARPKGRLHGDVYYGLMSQKSVTDFFATGTVRTPSDSSSLPTSPADPGNAVAPLAPTAAVLVVPAA